MFKQSFMFLVLRKIQKDENQQTYDHNYCVHYSAMFGVFVF